ncbi:MAG: ATP-binding protein [Nannocystis sp.]|nr:ATP-binding protein [Nannocystis sp.]MBA3546203.1 ATP-binding protein [Nannocystis sp.]
MAKDIHRSSEVSRLLASIEEAPEGLSIVGISGPGGVGKSFLLTHVLEAVEPHKLGWLVLTADAANPDTRGDFLGMVEGQLFRRSLPPPADRSKDYFPHLREVATLHRDLVDRAVAELSRQGAPEPVRRAALALLRNARVLNKAVPKSRIALDATRIDDADVEKVLDEAWEAVRALPGLRDSTALWGPIRDMLGITRRNRVKRDLYAFTAAEIRTDLSAALAGYERKDLSRLTQAPIPGLRRLILIIDDYEAVGGLLGDFLVGALVPELAAAPFQTIVIVVGRDDLETTHPGWAQHCRRFMREQIRLRPFDAGAADKVFAAAGIPEARWATLFEATQGYPFLISLAVEEAGDYGGESVVFLTRFHDRVTRWMTDREREWFLRICFLERIDEDSLRVCFPEENVTRIQDWFEREPSVRDPAAPYFRVRPMVRDKMLRYIEVRAPSRFRELTALAARAQQSSPHGPHP